MTNSVEIKMRFTVSTRIISGFAILMIFVGGMLMTGLWGLSKIKNGVHDLTDRAIPLINNSNSMSSALLHSKFYLMEYQANTKLSEIYNIEQKFNAEKDTILQTQAQLTELSQHDQTLADSINEVGSLNNEFISMSQALLKNHGLVVAQLEQIAKLHRQTIDTLDTTISKATDIQVEVSGNDRAQVTKFIDDLEKIGNNIKKAMENNIPAAVVGAKMQSKGHFAQLEKSLSSVKNLTSTEKQQKLTTAFQAFKNVVISDEGLLNSQVTMLRLKKQNADDFVKVGSKLTAIIAALKTIDTSIDELSSKTAKNAEDTVLSSRTLLISAGFFSLLASLITAIFVIRSITSPLKKMGITVTAISNGDLTNNFEGYNNDEFGDLATNLNILVKSLRDIIQELASNSQLLSSTAEQTSAASQATFTNIQHQKEQTDMIAAAVEEMAATVDEVAKNAASTLKEVEQAHTKVKQGEQVISDNINSITSLAHDIELSAEVIEKLNQRSNDIGGVLDVIRGVAEQTNLLALNAAIEAARAGEQGRGFAVVADEVRTLASRAHQSTAEIQEMIQQLQAGANHAVETMNNSRKQAQLRVESIAGAGQVLTAIADSVTTIKDMSYQIATASEEQSSTTREQNRNIVAIVESAEKTAVTAKENQSASKHLADMANEQLKMIQHFKM